MKKIFFLPVFLIAFGISGFAQGEASIVGKWVGTFPGQDGQLMTFTMTITDDAYSFDFNGDGAADQSGSYTASDGNQVTVWDTAGENICPAEKKGVYKYAFDGDTVTFTKVKDDCPGRGDEPMVLKRM